ncbi:hypothetical protein [Mycobacterium sp. NPDC050041]|uniref:hypothetical protein n=1 Tax=Mycobacterium sp. NPDC050041 TaxID=3364293 RepID=UPI003C2DB585
MSTPESAVQQVAQMSRFWVNEFNRVAVNASDYDKAGKWGLDGWIRVFHELIDLQIRTFAGVLQGGIAGPWWLELPENLAPVDPVEVPTARPYPRTISVSPFARVGRPDITIPPASLKFVNVLPPNAKLFEINLRDDRFIGSNYVGKVTLKNASNGAHDSTFEVTVGL